MNSKLSPYLLLFSFLFSSDEVEGVERIAEALHCHMWPEKTMLSRCCLAAIITTIYVVAFFLLFCCRSQQLGGEKDDDTEGVGKGDIHSSLVDAEEVAGENPKHKKKKKKKKKKNKNPNPDEKQNSSELEGGMPSSSGLTSAITLRDDLSGATNVDDFDALFEKMRFVRENSGTKTLQHLM